MKKTFIIVVSIICLLVIYPGTFVSYWFLRGILQPFYHSEIEQEYKRLPSEKLIAKLHTIDPVGPTASEAMMILAERGEKAAVPEIIKMVYSWNPYRRYHALLALGELGDERAIAPLMKIVEKGKEEEDYEDALMALSRLKCQEAYPYVVDLAETGDPFANGAVIMLGELGNPDAIPLLENIKGRIDVKQELSNLRLRQVDDAIQKLKK